MDIKELYGLREKLHENPETAFNETVTQKILFSFIEEKVKGLNNVKLNIGFMTSIIVEYSGGKKGEPYILFRADMDALAMNTGNMHACGHDIHMTVLAGLLAYTAETKPEKNILFVFQPGEEGAGGAKKMIEAGLFDGYKIKAAIALHVTDDYSLGEIASKTGVLFAIPREFDVIFTGVAGHAAFPEKGRDTIAAAALFMTNVYQAIAKKTDPMEPFLFHVGKIEGGSARNITADNCRLQGTMRALDIGVMEKGAKAVSDAAHFAASQFGACCEMITLGEFLPVINDPELCKKLQMVAAQAGLEYIEADTKLVGEDFGFFCERYPGLMFWLGTRNEGQPAVSLHSPDYYPDDTVISNGLDIMKRLLEE